MYRVFLVTLLFQSMWLNAQLHCGRDGMVKEQDWIERRAELESELQIYIQHNQLERNGPVTIPVVFHQVAENVDDFLPDSFFENQIDILNEDFGNYSLNNSATPFDLREIPVDMGIRFCLAKTDAEGIETTGIERVETSYSCIGNIGTAKGQDGRARIYYEELGGADAWDSRFYLNIWVAPTCGGFLGFATFPEEAIPSEDGVIISTEFLGERGANSTSYPFHLGRVCTHEVGHYFNLFHLWGTGGCNSDDMVDDTPMQESFHNGCPVHPSPSCDSPDYFFNFMDYSNDECLSMFTPGQRERALAALFTFREELLENAPCKNWGPDPSQTQWQIFPNPSVDLLYVIPPITWPRPIPYSIFDAMGRRIQEGILQQNPLAIDTKPLGAGLFFLRLENGTEQITQPFLSFP